jgi:hypothetical protein
MGDISVAAQSQGIVNRTRRVVLLILRDNETFPVRVEFPEAARTMPGPAAANDLNSARAYRDKLRERWHEIESLFRSGRYRSEDLLQAAKDLAQAELAADERRAALQQHVDRMKGFQSIVNAKVEGDVAPRSELLAVEAELLRAEAELAAETAKVGTAGTSPREHVPNLPTIALPPAASGQTPILRSAEEFNQRLKDAEKALSDMKSGFTDKTPKAVIERALRAPQQQLAFAREEYATQLRLLELELQDAESAAKAAEANYQSTRTLVKNNIVPQSKLNEALQGMESARIRIERAKTLLDLYRKADTAKSADDSAPGEQPADAGEKSRGRN